MQSNKLVYTAMCLDHLHHGHLNILKECKKLGKVVIGLMTDEAVASYKRVPSLSYEKRLAIAESLKDIHMILPQKTLDYRPNLRELKPDFVVNGDDWRTGVQKETRQQVIDVLKEWNGKLIEVPYTKGISSTIIIEDFRKNGVTPEQRMNMLRRLINVKPIVRVIEAHNGMSAMVAENTKFNGREFDAIWESSFTDSASKGKPDIELVDFTSRVNTINEILEVTTKPMIVDGDTGGQKEHFEFMVRTLERLGVSAIIIEDKKFPKINSLMSGAKHKQEDVKIFCEKIRAGKKAQITDDFMIFARVESFIAGKGLDDAVNRAKAYIDAGADGIMIHSKEPSASQIVSFCQRYKDFKKKVPLIIVPTTYCTMTEREMKYFGVNVVIYANHQLRAAYQSMRDVAEDILMMESCNVKGKCCEVKEIFDLTRRDSGAKPKTVNP